MTPLSTTPKPAFKFQSLRHAFEIGRELYRRSQRQELRRKICCGWDDEPKSQVKRLPTLEQVKQQAIDERIALLGVEAAAKSLNIGRSTIVYRRRKKGSCA